MHAHIHTRIAIHTPHQITSHRMASYYTTLHVSHCVTMSSHHMTSPAITIHYMKYMNYMYCMHILAYMREYNTHHMHIHRQLHTRITYNIHTHICTQIHAPRHTTSHDGTPHHNTLHIHMHTCMHTYIHACIARVTRHTHITIHTCITYVNKPAPNCNTYIAYTHPSH